MICIRSQRRSLKLHSYLRVSHVHWAGDRERLISPSHPRIRPSRWLRFSSLVLALLRSSLCLSISLFLCLSLEDPVARSLGQQPLLTIIFACLKLIRIIYSRCTRLISLHSHDYPRVRSNPSHILSTTTHGWRCDRGVTLSASHAAASLLRPGRSRRAPTCRRYPHQTRRSPLTCHPAEQWRLRRV